MLKLRAMHIFAGVVVLSLLIVSTLLVELAHYGLLAAFVFTLGNVVGATFPPVASMIDADNPLILASLALAGIANIAFTIIFATVFYQILVSVDIRYALMQRRIGGMSRHVIITPASEMGLMLARRLAMAKITSVFIDKDKYAVRRAVRRGFLAMQGDPEEQEALEHARVGSAFALCTLYDDDLKNTFVAIEARRNESKPPVLARIRKLDDIPKMERAGAKRVIMPEAAVGIEMGDFLVSSL